MSRFPTLLGRKNDKLNTLHSKFLSSSNKVHPNITSLSFANNTNTTLSEDANDNLLSWIDSLKIRASETFEKQKNELIQLRKDTEKDELRRKYREQIDLASFDKLGEILGQGIEAKTDSNERNTTVKSHNGRSMEESAVSDASIAAHALLHRDSPYPEDTQALSEDYEDYSDEEDVDDEEEVEEYESDEKDDEKASKTARYTALKVPKGSTVPAAATSRQELAAASEDDDVVEILLDESEEETPHQPAARSRHNEEYIETEFEEESIISESDEEEQEEEEEEEELAEDEDDDQEEDENSNGLLPNDDPHPIYHSQITSHQSVAYHLRDGRPRLSDTLSSQSHTRARLPNTHMHHKQDEMLMESEDLDEMSDNLDAVEKKYSDELLEDDVEDQLESGHYSESEKESYYDQARSSTEYEDRFEENVDSDQYDVVSDEEDGFEELSDKSDDMEEAPLEQGEARPSMGHGQDSSANFFAQENTQFQGTESEEEQDDEISRLKDETTFHDFEEDDDEDDGPEASLSQYMDPELEQRSQRLETNLASVNDQDSAEAIEVAQFMAGLQEYPYSNRVLAEIERNYALAELDQASQMEDELSAALGEESPAKTVIEPEQSINVDNIVESVEEAEEITNHSDETGQDFSLMVDAKSEFESEVDTDEEMADADVPDEADAAIDAIPPVFVAPKLPIFKSITQEDPKTVLKQLKKTERKFHVKLEAVDRLKSEYGEVLDSCSSAPSLPEYVDAAFHDARPPESDSKEAFSQDGSSSEMLKEKPEKMKQESISDKVEAAISAKPEVPVLAEISEDESMSESASEVMSELVETESEAASESVSISIHHGSSSSYNDHSNVYVLEPEIEEDILTVFDEYTEVENVQILAPSAIEEPSLSELGETFTETVTESVAVLATEVAFESLSDSEAGMSINPSEIIEPVDSSDEELPVFVETFEEAFAVTLPTSIDELESMRNTPVLFSVGASVSEVLEDEEFAYGDGEIDNDAELELSDEEEATGEAFTEDTDMESARSNESGSRADDLTDSVQNAELVNGSDVMTGVDLGEVNLEDLETHDKVDNNDDKALEKDENTDEFDGLEAAQEASETGISTLDTSTHRASLKRKSDDSERSSSPVKRLKTVFSKLNPFKWRLGSAEPELAHLVTEFTEDEAKRDESTTGMRSNESNETENDNVNEDDKSCVEASGDEETSGDGKVSDDRKDSEKAEIQNQDTTFVDRLIPETGKTSSDTDAHISATVNIVSDGVASVDEGFDSVSENVLEEAKQDITGENEVVKDDDKIIEDAGCDLESFGSAENQEFPLNPEMSEVSQIAEREEMQEMTSEHQINPLTNNTSLPLSAKLTHVVVDVPSHTEASSEAAEVTDKSEDVASEPLSLNDGESPDTQMVREDEDEESAATSRIIQLSVPPLPTPQSFIHIAESILLDLESELNSDSDSSDEPMEDEEKVMGAEDEKTALGLEADHGVFVGSDEADQNDENHQNGEILDSVGNLVHQENMDSIQNISLNSSKSDLPQKPETDAAEISNYIPSFTLIPPLTDNLVDDPLALEGKAMPGIHEEAESINQGEGDVESAAIRPSSNVTESGASHTGAVQSTEDHEPDAVEPSMTDMSTDNDKIVPEHENNKPVGEFGGADQRDKTILDASQPESDINSSSEFSPKKKFESGTSNEPRNDAHTKKSSNDQEHSRLASLIQLIREKAERKLEEKKNRGNTGLAELDGDEINIQKEDNVDENPTGSKEDELHEMDIAQKEDYQTPSITDSPLVTSSAVKPEVESETILQTEQTEPEGSESVDAASPNKTSENGLSEDLEAPKTPKRNLPGKSIELAKKPQLNKPVLRVLRNRKPVTDEHGAKATKSVPSEYSDGGVQEDGLSRPESRDESREEEKLPIPDGKDSEVQAKLEPEEEPAPPKRGRGRPPKNAAKAPPKVEKKDVAVPKKRGRKSAADKLAEKMAEKQEYEDIKSEASPTTEPPASSPQKNRRKHAVANSAPLKSKRGPMSKPKSSPIEEMTDPLSSPDPHLAVEGTNDEDHPALRTRSKSPIKRSIQELSSEIDEEPIRKRRSLRTRKLSQKFDAAEAEHELNTRGRPRRR